MAGELVECPICLQSFKQISIEKHVNTCLLSHDEKPKTRSIKGDVQQEKTSFFQKRSGKRKSCELKNSENSNQNKTETPPPLPRLPSDSSEVSHKEQSEDVIEIIPSPKRMKIDTNKIEKNNMHDITSLQNTKGVFGKNTGNKSGSNEITKPNKETLIVITNDDEKKKERIILGKVPLAELMRPVSLDHYYGQHAVDSQNILKDLFYNDKIPSMILWGPPGCGKTSLAHIISQRCKSGRKYRFVSLSATNSGVNDVKESIKVAKNEWKLIQRKTVLFIDEVHRFNKLQQDTFLPHVEDGTIILIGATTENPSFHINNALMSRCRVVVLNQLDSQSIEKILRKAVNKLGGKETGENSNSCPEEELRFTLESGVIKLLSDFSNGDARIALNSLDMILQSKISPNVNKQTNVYVTCDQVKNELKSSHIPYDRNGDEHYDIISALHKSIRGSNVDASLYWLARMLEGGEQPLYIARRLVRFASEDIGMADPNALQQAVSAYQACHFIGMPECDVILAQLVVYLSKAAKSISVYEGYKKAKALVMTWSGAQPKVPLHIRNAPTKLMKNLGYGKDYKYTPKCDDKHQEYFPDSLIGTKFYDDDES